MGDGLGRLLMGGIPHTRGESEQTRGWQKLQAIHGWRGCHDREERDV